MTGGQASGDVLLDRCASCGRCRGICTHAGYHALPEAGGCECDAWRGRHDAQFATEFAAAAMVSLAAACLIFW